MCLLCSCEPSFLFSLSQSWNDVAAVNLKRLFFLAAHQINIELGHTRALQLAEPADVLLHRSDNTKAVHDLVRDKAFIRAAHLTVLKIIVAVAGAYIGGQALG